MDDRVSAATAVGSNVRLYNNTLRLPHTSQLRPPSGQLSARVCAQCGVTLYWIFFMSRLRSIITSAKLQMYHTCARKFAISLTAFLNFKGLRCGHTRTPVRAVT